MIEIKLTFDCPEDAAQAMYRLAGLNDPTLNAVMDTTSAVALGTALPVETGEASAAKRHRRTKAEMEAARAAEQGGAPANGNQETVDATDTPPVEAEAEATDDAAPIEAASVATVEAAVEATDTKPPSDEEVETKRREVARPALQLVINAGGQDAARDFINNYGFAGVKFLPYEAIDDFAAKCAVEADRLKSEKKAA